MYSKFGVKIFKTIHFNFIVKLNHLKHDVNATKNVLAKDNPTTYSLALTFVPTHQIIELKPQYTFQSPSDHLQGILKTTEVPYSL